LVSPALPHGAKKHFSANKVVKNTPMAGGHTANVCVAAVFYLAVVQP
jgi:hypothetical protein